jgi:hypothetical protein
LEVADNGESLMLGQTGEDFVDRCVFRHHLHLIPGNTGYSNGTSMSRRRDSLE